jgi:hypothetical protein
VNPISTAICQCRSCGEQWIGVYGDHRCRPDKLKASKQDIININAKLDEIIKLLQSNQQREAKS